MALIYSGVSAAVICVDDDAPGDPEDGSALFPYRSVGSAVQAAASGDEIRIAAGAYPEHLVVDTKALCLRGGFPGGTAQGYADGVAGDFGTQDPSAHVSHIQGDGSAAVIRFRRVGNVDGFTHVDGLRLTGGTRGIHFDHEYPSGDFRDFVISRNTIEDNGFHHPSFYHRGGGIAVAGAGILISDNIIRNNTADTGAGIGGSADTLVIAANVIEENIGWGDHGGGLWLGGTGSVTHNIIRDNVIGELAGYGWGGGMLVVGVWEVSFNVISGNTAPTLGGGVFADEGAYAILDHNLVVENQTLTEWVKGGAGIYVDRAWDDTPSVAHITQCTVAFNTSPGTNGGNGVYVEGSEVLVRNCIFWGNSGGDDFYADAASILTVQYTLSQESVAGPGTISVDPELADPTAGDYHVQSMAGRWDPAQGTSGAWMVDEVHSPAIDAGDPGAPYALESFPHGARVNLGYFGNTPEASRSCMEYGW